jgi:NADPH:quinone reductase-like Zn-dependent oxidoreductase
VGKRAYGDVKRALTPRGIYLTTVLSMRIVRQMLWTKLTARKAKLALTGLRSGPDKSRDLAQILAWAREGRLRPVIDRVLPLEETADAHRRVETGHKVGSVIVTP